MAEDADRPVSERRTAVARAALEVFLSKGYARASMVDIAKAAGIEKASLYHHFSSKDELFLFALSEDFAQPMEEVRAIVADPTKDPVAVLSGALEILYEVMLQSTVGRFTTVIIEASRAVPEVAQGFHDHFIVEFENTLAMASEPARRAGLMREFPPETLNLLVFAPLLELSISAVIFDSLPDLKNKYIRQTGKEDYVNTTLSILLK